MFMLNADTNANNIYLGSTLIPKVEGACEVIISSLETLPTHIVTSPLASLRLFCSFCFELPILATEPIYNTLVLLGVLVRYISITHISNILLLKLPAFLSTKYLRQFPYQ